MVVVRGLCKRLFFVGYYRVFGLVLLVFLGFCVGLVCGGLLFVWLLLVGLLVVCFLVGGFYGCGGLLFCWICEGLFVEFVCD